MNLQNNLPIQFRQHNIRIKRRSKQTICKVVERQSFLLSSKSIKSKPLLRHRPSTRLHQALRSWDYIFNYFQTYPVSLTSASRSLRHVFLGRPLFLFPSGFQIKACRVMPLTGFWRLWPIHLQRLSDLLFHRHLTCAFEVVPHNVVVWVCYLTRLFSNVLPACISVILLRC